VYTWGWPAGASRPGSDTFSWPLYDGVRKRSTVLRDLAAYYSTAPLQVSAAGETAEVQGAVVSANYLSMLGLQPAPGRFFRPEEDHERGRDPVAVMSMSFGQRRFGADPTIISRSISINGLVFCIVRVAPE
jgi:hypothetical protein